MHYRLWKTSLVAITLGTSILMGCSDQPSTNTNTTSGSSSSSGQGGGGGQGGAGGSGGMGGSGGEGGGVMAVPGAPGNALVNGGNTVKSQNYKMVFTIGQSSPAQGPLKSSQYRLNGGFIGATGSP